jgi:hypothetical protein
MSVNLDSDGGHSSCEFNCVPSPGEGSVYSHVYRVVMTALSYEWDRGRNWDLSSSYLQFYFTGLFNYRTHRWHGFLKNISRYNQHYARVLHPLIILKIPNVPVNIYVTHISLYVSRTSIHSARMYVYSILYYTVEALSMATVLKEDYHPHLGLTWCERVQYYKTTCDRFLVAIHTSYLCIDD